MLPAPEALVFDMGGVLFESMDMWTAEGFPRSYPGGLPDGVPLDWFLGLSQACLDAFSALPVPHPALDLRPLVAEWLHRGGLPATTGDVDRWVDFLGRWEVRPFYPFVPQTLQTLRAMGYRLGLVSNTLAGRMVHYRPHFQAAGLLDLFEFLVFSADYGVNKPHPAIFRHALDALRVPPSRAWYIGDKPHRDVCGAHGVGMTAVLVDGPHGHRVADAPENMPDLRIPTIAALPAFLRSLAPAS